MFFAFVYSLLRLLLDVADVRLRVRDPEAELLLLRHQLHVVRRQVKRPQLDVADRAIMAALSHRVSRAAWIGMLVQPETVLGWHRQLVRRNWAAFGRRRGPGRSGLDSELQKLILEMARDNPKWVRGTLIHRWVGYPEWLDVAASIASDVDRVCLLPRAPPPRRRRRALAGSRP